jgi:C4-dicarboxylate-specific signal transduction histidine kinase
LTQSLRPDVVLMDIEMPDIDGIEATRRIQARCPTPVVVLTAYETPELVEQASAAGVGAYIVKPPDAREMVRAIAIALARFQDLMALRRLNAELAAEIAERRRLQAQLQEYTQHLEKLVDVKVRELERERARAVHADKLAALGELATSVAHELNQPLTVMLLKSDYFKMAAERIKAEVGEGSPNARFYDELYQVGEELAEDVGRCSRIIGHLRTFGRISEGHATDVNLNDPIEDSFILVGERLRHHDIEVHLQLAQDLPPILADPHRLEQVFLNLINNAEYALEEMARRATSTPSTTYHKHLEIATFVEGDWVVATVNDNGCGIPTAAQEHIFESFFTTKPMGEGTGLGLSISHDILIEYGAEITFESAENEGTTFKLRFPVLDKDTSAS